MIVRLSGADEPRYPALFMQMYRQRHDVYVKRRKWLGLNATGEIEKDQFDTGDATYLLVLDASDRVLAGLRLLPTSGPHLLGDVFSHLARDGPIPRARDVLELTRFYVARPVRGAGAQHLVGILAAGLFEHCLESGVERLTSVVDTFLLPRMKQLGWQVRALGAPGRYGEGTAVAVEIAVTKTVLDVICQRRGIDRPVLRKTPANAPLATTGPSG